MPRSRRLVLPATLAGAALAYPLYRRALDRLVENLRLYSAPAAGLYDVLATPMLGGFFARVAEEVACTAPGGKVLEVGSGPGRLAVKLAEREPDMRVTGLDIAPEMVERAEALATSSGVADRACFVVGDVASLPFPEASFDALVSTFSLHHWPDPSRGLAEIHRVLRPGGVAMIYDLVSWIRRFEHGGQTAAELAVGGPFGKSGVRERGLAAKLGPIPLVYLAVLGREQGDATGGCSG